MRFPNKITSLNESVIGKATIILNILNEQDLSVNDLYKKTKKSFSSFPEYIDTLDYLYALNKIALKSRGDLLHYVK